MIKIILECNKCQAQVSTSIRIPKSRAHWATQLWAKAIDNGWMRGPDTFAAYCADCVDMLKNPSNKRSPVAQMSFVWVIECEGCNKEFRDKFAELGEHFSHQLRRNAKKDNWQHITLDEGKSYGDFCQQCAKNAKQSRYTKLMTLVWSEATERAAQKIGISGKALEKQCKRLGVPKPPPGFWAKWHAGHMDRCRALIPDEVYDTLGNEFVDEKFPT